MFVIQKYDATNLHYDFRLEVDLKGEILSGGYALVKMKNGKMEGNWLLT